MNKSPSWAQLPTLVLTKIFDFLTPHERIQASTTCTHWRFVYFQPRFFKHLKFVIRRANDKKNHFYLTSLAHLVKEATIIFDSNSLYEVELTTDIIYKLSTSSCLVGLYLRPKYPTLISPGDNYYEEERDFTYQCFIEPIKALLSRCQPSFKSLDLGCSEKLTLYTLDIVKNTKKPQDFILYGLSSIKQDPSHYALYSVEPNLFEKFTSLQILSIDYDIMYDEFLQGLQLLPLKKLIIHVHGLDDEHPGITEASWALFRLKNPNVELHLNLIYAYEAVDVLHSHIFRPSMPLTHLKVLFSRRINNEALEYLSQYFHDTLKSVVWIDSGFQNFERNIMDLFLNTDQDPFVMMAWHCKKLQEIVIHGYVLDPHNLIGISRLRGRGLKKLEVSIYDLAHTLIVLESFMEEISTQLGQNWTPLNDKNLNPAIGILPVTNKVRDNYILEMVRSDLN